MSSGNLAWPFWGALTVISGMVDAISYVALGQVFTGNMTGNLLIMGFAAGGVAQLSVVATLISLASFFAGAALGGQLTARVGDVRRRLVIAFAAESVMHVIAAMAAFALPVTKPAGQYPLIVILAVTMGARNTVVRRLKIADINTTVVTGTLTNLAADSPFGTGAQTRAGRRTGQIGALVLGAFVGTLLLLHFGPPGALTAMAVFSCLITGSHIVFAVVRGRSGPR
ncbi:YoaK family protein [Nonomuraea sp. NPDC048916]|uniref:YoaK family protein n=1 Tax=Nonomuraea sp. NPDC048916 TaxID=3154232 RepID=UPI0033C7949B